MTAVDAHVEDEDWPRIRQAVVEVHDTDGRLAAIVALLNERHLGAVLRERCAGD